MAIAVFMAGFIALRLISVKAEKIVAGDGRARAIGKILLNMSGSRDVDKIGTFRAEHELVSIEDHQVRHMET